MRHRERIGRLALGALGLLVAPSAQALPEAPPAVCVHLPDSPACASGAVECSLCHSVPPARNAYGAQLAAAILPGAPRPLNSQDFLAALPAALDAVAALDADGDGAPNGAELAAGSHPADPASRPTVRADCSGAEGGADWDVCRYDPVYVLKKLSLDVCGHSPRRAEIEALRAAPDPRAALHVALDRCLASEHWRGKDGVVWRLAHDKIRPVQSIKSGEEDPGDIPLADYHDDYAYFVYTQTGDRDARDVLLGQYFVAREDTPEGTRYTPWDRSPQEDFAARGFGPAQLVPKARRAGLLTHRWFLMSNTMFTAVPRTTAAQALRAYLGLDLAKLEGLEPGLPVPVDYDRKGVDADACAVCHATLDPLTYPFTRYEGIQGGDEQPRRIPFTYNPTRLDAFASTDGAAVVDTPEAGRLFGQPVADLRAWVEVAAASEQFALATTRDYWRIFFGEDPSGPEQAEFTALWRAFMTTHDYRVERLLHALIDTEAYGVP